jgi:hypothetical protein
MNCLKREGSLQCMLYIWLMTIYILSKEISNIRMIVFYLYYPFWHNTHMGTFVDILSQKKIIRTQEYSFYNQLGWYIHSMEIYRDRIS